MNIPANITLLDCTLRDGGYYTNWNFDPVLVSQYISICNKVHIDVIELGYLSFSENNLGNYANIPEQLNVEIVKSLEAYRNLRLAVMINVKDLTAFDPETAVKQLQKRLLNFPIPIKIVRLAAGFKNIDSIYPYLLLLENAGFQICLNLMQIDLASAEELENCIKILTKFDNFGAIYIADSLGSLRPEKVTHLIQHFKNKLGSPIGFHAHDNLGLALHNSLVAVKAGATWIDSTFGGMGRGAGNAKTEQLYPLLFERVSSEIQFELYSFAALNFKKLHDQYQWGSSALYGMSGVAKIHPSYLQLLDANKVFSMSKKIEIVFRLFEMNAFHFSTELLDKATKVYA